MTSDQERQAMRERLEESATVWMKVQNTGGDVTMWPGGGELARWVRIEDALAFTLDWHESELARAREEAARGAALEFADVERYLREVEQDGIGEGSQRARLINTELDRRATLLAAKEAEIARLRQALSHCTCGNFFDREDLLNGVSQPQDAARATRVCWVGARDPDDACYGVIEASRTVETDEDAPVECEDGQDVYEVELRARRLKAERAGKETR